MSLPTPEQLQRAWVKLQAIHQEHLAVHDVCIPQVTRYSENSKATWLAILWHYQDQTIHKDEISAIVRRDIKGAAADQQVRHLKRDGWEIGQDQGQHRLDPYRPSQEFVNASARRRVRLNAGTFDDIKRSFGYRCATCGAREGGPDPRYGEGHVQIQQGHQDPNGAGDDPDNIIPQCQFCNRSYKSDFVFDDKGRVRAVASAQPVRRASRSVQLKVLTWLKQNFGEDDQ